MANKYLNIIIIIKYNNFIFINYYYIKTILYFLKINFKIIIDTEFFL